MKISGIIAEYNPFHNGHKYHIEQTRALGYTHIAAVMSGNVVQRGEFSICDKWQRAKAAIENGIDIVFELPCTSSLKNAEGFAFGAIEIFKNLECVDALSFGSECENIEILKETAKACEAFSNSDDLKRLLENGFSYPSAMQKLITENHGEKIGNVISSPNNTLAIEYIKALGDKILPVCIKRKGTLHDSDVTNGNFASASYIRNIINSSSDYYEFTPSKYENFSNQSKLELAILKKLRTMSKEDFSKLYDVNQGLENRIYQVVQSEVTLNDIVDKICTRRYTQAKIKRILLSAFLGITKEDAKLPLPYIRILAMNDRGKEILSASKNCVLPIDTSFYNLYSSSKNAEILAKIEARVTDIFFLSTNKILPCKTDFTHKPVIV